MVYAGSSLFLLFKTSNNNPGGAANKEKGTYYEEVKLEKCGCNAIIAKETISGTGTKLSALIFKENQQNRTRLYVWNPEDDQMFIKIFKTHVFK